MSTQRSLTAAKKLVRKELRTRLKALTDDAKQKEAKIISQKLFNSKVYQNAKSLSIYLSMPSEVYTLDILHRIFESKKKCYVPHYIGDNMSMVLLKDQADYNSLPLTSWNIKQPADDEVRECALDSDDGLDMIIVPGLGFTKNGHRLGRGKGYYDKYFQKYEQAFNKRPYLLGLAYTCQLLDEIPTDEYDVMLDEVLVV